MDVVVWLRSLGLEQYEAAFRENADQRKRPAEADGGGPEEIWASPSLGHRRVLLDAIAELRSETKAEQAPPEASSTTAEPAKDTAAPNAAKSR